MMTLPPSAADLNVKIFGDGATVAEMVGLYRRSAVQGFTTNPTLMRKAGVRDYEAFAHDVLRTIRTLPVSFEVFSDNFPEMAAQAHAIASWADNVYVKVPITNTLGQSSCELAHRLSHSGVKVNLTALLTLDQVTAAVAALRGGAPSMISVFAGRIADTGRDPMPIMREAAAIVASTAATELIWASPREVLNVFQAEAVGCHIITLTGDLLTKLALCAKPLAEFSLETVKMFHNDAMHAGFTLKTQRQPA